MASERGKYQGRKISHGFGGGDAIPALERRTGLRRALPRHPKTVSTSSKRERIKQGKGTDKEAEVVDPVERKQPSHGGLVDGRARLGEGGLAAKHTRRGTRSRSQMKTCC